MGYLKNFSRALAAIALYLTLAPVVGTLRALWYLTKAIGIVLVVLYCLITAPIKLLEQAVRGQKVIKLSRLYLNLKGLLTFE